MASKNFSRLPLASADNSDMIGLYHERKATTMSPDGTHNGYANYQTWNVCLWISNDEMLYDLAKKCDSYNHFRLLLREMFDSHQLRYETPDGVAWNDSGVNLHELAEFWAENFSQVRA